MLSTIQTVSDDDDIMIITNTGTIIRMSVSDINVYSRTAAGVIVMRLGDGNRIVTVSRLEKSEEIEAESQALDKESAEKGDGNTEIIKALPLDETEDGDESAAEGEE
jgi:DNA gyrase subunit A